METRNDLLLDLNSFSVIKTGKFETNNSVSP